MNRIFVHGLGAVSPAGWGVAALRESLDRQTALPAQRLSRPGWETTLNSRPVPPPAQKLSCLNHARLRRTGPITQFSLASALEAIGEDARPIRAGIFQLGIIVCTMTGGLSFSRRFYEEVLQEPATASPMVFPETVFNAVASHISAYLGSDTVNYTMVGDGGVFLPALALAAEWLARETVEACLVIGAEEADWTAADALRLFDREAIHTAGAGALYLKRQFPATSPVELKAITDSFPTTRHPRGDQSARRMRDQLPAGNADELLCENETRHAAWPEWKGARWAPRETLGEAFAASTAWQCVAACDALRRRAYAAANVSVTGLGRQTIGARFATVDSTQRD